MQFALTVDVEGSWFDLPQEQADFDPEPVRIAVETLEKHLDEAIGHFGQAIPVTWFMRCDDSVAASLGAPEGFLRFFADFIHRRTERGDEFGLHPHLYALSADGRTWCTDLDPESQAAQIARACAGWQTYFGSPPRLSRIGESLMTPAIAAALESNGISIDSTALAGRKRLDGGFRINWEGTPAAPYSPSRSDHRLPPSDNQPAYGFVEVPFTMLPTLAPYDTQPISRYLNLAFEPKILSPGLGSLVGRKNLIGVLHPHEVMPTTSSRPLVGHGTGHFLRNLQDIKQICGDLEFVRLTELL